MSFRVRLVIVIVTVGLVVAVIYGAQAWREPVRPMTLRPVVTFTSEGVLRASVTATTRPICSKDSLPVGRAAVVVARVYLDADGKVLYAQVEEAHSAVAAQSVLDSLRRWKFTAPEVVGGAAQALSATLTYYFVNSKDGCSVIYPEEASYLGDILLRPDIPVKKGGELL